MSTKAVEQRKDQPMFDLTGRVALVTGTSRGLGQSFARALARCGADLILTSRKQQDLLPFPEEIHAMGRKAVALELDVREDGRTDTRRLRRHRHPGQQRGM
jgi:short-subunit dehydrogenase